MVMQELRNEANKHFIFNVELFCDEEICRPDATSDQAAGTSNDQTDPAPREEEQPARCRRRVTLA